MPPAAACFFTASMARCFTRPLVALPFRRANVLTKTPPSPIPAASGSARRHRQAAPCPQPRAASARRGGPAHRPRAAGQLGGIGGMGYALRCRNYAPLCALLVACTLTGLLQPSVAEIERRLSALPHLCAAALSIFCALILAERGITALGAQRESLLSATAGITLCSALLIGSCLAACFAHWVAPRFSARRQQRLNAKHEAYAASNSLVLRARVTGALNRRQENE